MAVIGAHIGPTGEAATAEMRHKGMECRGSLNGRAKEGRTCHLKPRGLGSRSDSIADDMRCPSKVRPSSQLKPCVLVCKIKGLGLKSAPAPIPSHQPIAASYMASNRPLDLSVLPLLDLRQGCT